VERIQNRACVAAAGGGLADGAEKAVRPTCELLMQRLKLAHRWYAGMVDPSTGMLEYLYVPGAAARFRERSPIRDIASV
jgi:hypothetical protein